MLHVKYGWNWHVVTLLLRIIIIMSYEEEKVLKHPDQNSANMVLCEWDRELKCLSGCEATTRTFSFAAQ